VVLELWDLEDPTDGPDGHHFVLGLLACWCEDPLNLEDAGNGNRVLLYHIMFSSWCASESGGDCVFRFLCSVFFG